MAIEQSLEQFDLRDLFNLLKMTVDFSSSFENVASIYAKVKFSLKITWWKEKMNSTINLLYLRSTEINFPIFASGDQFKKYLRWIMELLNNSDCLNFN